MISVGLNFCIFFPCQTTSNSFDTRLLTHLCVSVGFFLIFMGVVSFIFFICAFRTNVCFVIIFLTLVLTFALLTVAYWLLAEDFTGNASMANDFVIVSSLLRCKICLSVPENTIKLTTPRPVEHVLSSVARLAGGYSLPSSSSPLIFLSSCRWVIWVAWSGPGASLDLLMSAVKMFSDGTFFPDSLAGLTVVAWW